MGLRLLGSRPEEMMEPRKERDKCAVRRNERRQMHIVIGQCFNVPARGAVAVLPFRAQSVLTVGGSTAGANSPVSPEPEQNSGDGSRRRHRPGTRAERFRPSRAKR